MAGSTNNKKDSAGRRLGIKKWGRAEVLKGDILAKQRGFKWHPGHNVHTGKDHTIHASREGAVAWSRDSYAPRKRSRMHVVPMETPNRKLPTPPPFVYHPELYSELAAFNPTPTEFEIPKRKLKQVRTPNKLKLSIVDEPSTDTGFIDVSKLITP